MGATSVTGTGLGSADGHNKGPHNGRDLFVPLQSAHVVAAGTGTLGSGTLAVTFPTPISGGAAGNVALAESLTGNRARVSAKTNDGDGNLESITITGTGTD